MAEKKQTNPDSRDKTGRDTQGRFMKGVSGNPGGRPKLPLQFGEYAKQSPARLRALADDPDTPIKVKADIERWFAEMWYGRAAQQIDLDGKMDQSSEIKVAFEGKLDEWSK